MKLNNKVNSSLTSKMLINIMIEPHINIIKKNTKKRVSKAKDEEINKGEDINNLPFTVAVRKDKRNFFQIFMSVIFQKLELIDLIFGEHKVKIVLIYQYILSLIIDFFFNTLLFSDEAVSNKYHNNGKLDLIVTLTLSLASNIITSIICWYLNFSKGVEEQLEQIMEIKREFNYLCSLNNFIKILKIKVLLYLFIQILIAVLFFYYIAIFCIIYRNSQISLLINYLTSILDSLITSILVSIIIVITRKIGIVYLNNNFYNTSKFINNKF